jgi:hypothetical protein
MHALPTIAAQQRAFGENNIVLDVHITFKECPQVARGFVTCVGEFEVPPEFCQVAKLSMPR